MLEAPLQFTPESKTYDLRLTSFFLENQKQFSSRFMDVDSFVKTSELLAPTPKEDPRVFWTKDIVRAAIIEASELTYEMPWKHWQDYSEWKPRKKKIHEETSDIFNHVMNLAVTMGIEAEDIGPIEAYFDAHREELKSNGHPPFYTLTPHEKAVLTIENVDKLHDILSDIRQLFPDEDDPYYFEWEPDYESYMKQYKKLVSLYTKQCLVWGVDEKVLYDEYVKKREKTLSAMLGEGYKWDPNGSFEA